MTVASLAIRVLLVAVIAALVGVAALVFSRGQEPQYSASTDLLVGSSVRPELAVLGPPFTGDGTDNAIRMNTVAAVAGSHAVAESTARAKPDLRYDGDEIAARVTVAALPQSQVLRITATGPSAAKAAELVTTYRQQYLAAERDRERRNATRVQASVQQRFDNLPRSDQKGTLGAALRNQIAALRELARVGALPQVIDPLRASTAPSAPKTGRNVLFGLLFGLAVGIGLVALRSELDRRGAGPRAGRFEHEPSGNGEVLSETTAR
jgi:capsular polysaccharide biosynthesis protein